MSNTKGNDLSVIIAIFVSLLAPLTIIMLALSSKTPLTGETFSWLAILGMVVALIFAGFVAKKLLSVDPESQSSLLDPRSSDLAVTIGALLAVLSPLTILLQALSVNTPLPMKSDNSTVEDRIRPVVLLADLKSSAGASSSDSGAPKTPEAMYQGACMACHASGVAGAPVMGDNAAWSSKAAAGIDSLLNSAVNGKGAMPPRGGSSLSDDEIRSVIEYILSESGV